MSGPRQSTLQIEHRRILWAASLLTAAILALTAGVWVSSAADQDHGSAREVRLVPTIPPLGIALNEVLPQPRDVDWNGDGSKDDGDEYIELHNANDFNFLFIDGWVLDNGTTVPDDLGLKQTTAYTIPAGTVIPAGDFMVFFRKETGIDLADTGGGVRLLLPGGEVQDAFVYTSSAPDQSWSRIVDGRGVWSSACVASPGATNDNSPPCCPDFDASGTVDVGDITTIAGLWNGPVGQPHFDRDGDGQITIVDIMMVVARFGDAC